MRTACPARQARHSAGAWYTRFPETSPLYAKLHHLL